MDRQKLSLMGSAGLGAGLGAGLMYLLDPQGGGQRRALARNKTVSALKTGGNACLKTGKHLGNRTKGLVAEAGSRLRRETVDEQVLSDRVRSKLGRAVSNPSAIEVTAVDGLVILSGPVLVSEKARLLAAVAKVKGVKDVDDQLEIHEHSDPTSLLEDQGKGRSGSRLPKILAGTALGAVGVGLLAGGIAKRKSRNLREQGGDGSVGLDSSLETSSPQSSSLETSSLETSSLDSAPLGSSQLTGAQEAGVQDLSSGSLESVLSEDRELQTTLP